MRGIQIPAAASRFVLALLAALVAAGCGTAPHQGRPGTALASAAKAVSRLVTASHTVTGSHPAAPSHAGTATNVRLDAIAFTGPAAGYGIFTRQAAGRCQVLAGRTTDAGARFGALAPVTTWPCGGTMPGSSLAADAHGDAFLYDPGLLVTHDGGRTWARQSQPGTVLAIATAGRSAWMVRADCPRHGGTCPLRLLESADGGRTWAPSPAQPPGAIPGQPGGEPADGQSWLVRTGRSSGYVLSSPVGDHAPMWFTGDGGATWSARSLRCGRVAAMSATLAAAPDGTLLAGCAGQPAAGYQQKSAGYSADGGSSWTVRTPCPISRMTCHNGSPLDSGSLGQIAAVSARTGFLTGARSSLLVTRDGGIRWRTVRPLIGDSSGGTSQVIFVNRRDGFVLGDDFRSNEAPTIWRTTDGGTRWSGVVPRP